MSPLVTSALAYVVNRLKEPSTWASIAVAIVGVNAPQVTAALHGLVPYLAAAAAGLGVVMPEAK